MEASDLVREMFTECVQALIAQLTDLQLVCMDDPDHPDTEAHFRRCDDCLRSTVERLATASASRPRNDVRSMQRCFGRALRPFLGKSVVFRRALEKPFGYPGDYLLMDMIVAHTVSARGLGYHFDRMFLESPGSHAVRYRTRWAVQRLLRSLDKHSRRSMTLLDLGCGPMVIEEALIQTAPPETSFMMIGVDFDQRALRHAHRRMRRPNVRVEMQCCNVRDRQAIQMLRRVASTADACLCMGLFDYLPDASIISIFDALRGVGKETPLILVGNFHPAHPSRREMEWCVDWRLVYRTEAEMVQLALAAGFDRRKMSTHLDETGSVVLLEVGR